MNAFERLIGVPSAIIVLSLIFIGCKDAGKDKVPQSGDDAAEQRYEISGKVVAVDPERKKVTLDHEDIPGLMKGMEMEFAVEDSAILQGVEAGHLVQGRLVVKEGNYVITELKKREP